MENMEITQEDGEPPIYREMKPVPVTLESCILNTEDDYSYGQNEQSLSATNNCDEGELSAEEISSMIMINEGPDALSSVQNELEASKMSKTIRNSSDIKKILTSDLPKAGRFLSTKSLQRLSGARKVSLKNSKHRNEDETDVDDSSDTKVKKMFNKKNKAVKENLEKTNQSKLLKHKVGKKDVKVDKTKMKSVKKANSLEKLPIRKKFKTLKKAGLNKSKELNSTTKIFKKKVLESNCVVKKKEVPEDEESESGVIKTTTSKSVIEKLDTVKKPKLLISRSGRVRKIKNVSDFILSKEAKVLSSELNQVGEPVEDEKKTEISKRPVPARENSKSENGKENKSRGDLLQSALSESVESWFDVPTSVEQKGKRTKGRVKIIPKDSDSFFEETESNKIDKNTDNPSENSKVYSEPVNEEIISKGIEKTNDEAESIQKENDSRNLESVNEAPEEGKIAEKHTSEDDAEKNMKSDITEKHIDVDVTETTNIESDILEQKPVGEEKKEDDKKPTGKKIKSANRQLMGYKKKRRKSRNISVKSYLKNYGEKIDFEVKLEPELGESKKQNEIRGEENNLKNDVAEETSNNKALEKHLEIELDKLKKEEKSTKTSPLKRSLSAESLRDSCNPKTESPRKTFEEPASLPSRVKKLEKNWEEAEELKQKETIKLQENDPKKDKYSIKNKPIEDTVEIKTLNTSDDKKLQNEQGSNPEIDDDVKFEITGDINKKKNNAKVFGMKNEKKHLWSISRRKRFAQRKAARKRPPKKSTEGLPKTTENKPADVEQNPESLVKEKLIEGSEEKPTASESPINSVLSIPLKKRPRRAKAIEGVDDAGKENKEGKQDFERRKSHREIKLTPKIVDMIATSFSCKRPRKISSSKEESTSVKIETESSGLTHKSEGGPEMNAAVPGSCPSRDPKGDSSQQPLAVASSVENYLQSKMEANASNFESSWEPGDLVWARFAGNPFWPALILRDPFSNDEYSRVKYLGRLPRPFVHVQFLADFGRRAWGPELYIMNFIGLEEFEKLKSSLPEVNAFTQRKDLIYQQAFFTPKKMEKSWMNAVKEGETLLNKSKDERITYMKIKYPLVKYAESVANGRLVPNERTKNGDLKSPQSKTRKRRSVNSVSGPEDGSGEWQEKESEDAASKDTFECFNTSDIDEGIKKSQKESPKITLKLIRSPKKGSKRKSKSVDEAEEKKIKKRIKKEILDDDYVPSDSGSNGEKGSETTSNKQRKYFLFKGAKTEKVCQICIEILENEKTVKCKGACQGLFHKSCAEKMSAELPPLEDGVNKRVKKRRKKLFADGENSTDAQPKESTEKEWRCNDCLRGVNPCFVCNSRSGNRQRCCVAYCGKFYHQKCLKLYPQTIYNQGAPIRKSQSLQQSKTAESESPHYQILSCPLHVCHTCASDNPADFNMKYLCEKLVKCIKCPSAYHVGNYCVPAGSTILNTSQIICAKHGDPGKKSHVNISWCFICNMGGSLICCEWCPSSFHLDCLNIKPPDGPYICEECESGRFPLYGEVVWVKLGRYRWWPARVLFPQEVPPNILFLPHKSWEFAVRFYGSNDHYWLNRGRVFLYQEGDSEQKFKGQSRVDKIYQRAVQEATKDYFAIQEERKSRLLGTSNSGVMKPPPYVKIKTNKAVGKVQLGNISQSEPQTCDCDPNSGAPCSPGSDCLNRMLLVECNPNYCNAGARCENQSFEKREYPPLEPYRTETRGWGLRSTVDIPKGSFVIEYVGEVVDDEEFKRRMKRKQETKDSNYYFLTIDKDRMIDAGPKGNLARFMNHSCSPNCETQKWTVNGDTRVGLFALRDIPAGTELTFNYNLDCIGNEKKACHCEEENCSGFIGVKAKNDKSEALKNKIIKRLEKESEDECFVCNDGGELMVCDVPNCPKVYHMECVNLTEWPNELWFCPRHRCSLCIKTTKRCCRLCPTAYCFAHLDNNMFPDNQGGLLCSKHSTCALKPAQTFRKASYVNRNTPVVEYEKPFAEKYRPPQKERLSPEEKKEEILMEPNLTDNTPIVVENPLLSSATPSRLSDGVSVQVLYVDEEGQIISVDGSSSPGAETVTGLIESEEVPKPVKRKKRTNIPRKKLLPPVATEGTENKQKSPTQGGINFESLMIKSVEDKILDSKLNMDNIYNIIGGRGGEGEGETGQTETDGGERYIRDDSNDMKPETMNKKEDSEVDRSRRSKYFKIITPEKFIKVSESESNQKKVTDFNYIEFMHPLRSARSKTKTDENTRK